MGGPSGLSTPDDSCTYAKDKTCDEGTSSCRAGTDCTDCATYNAQPCYEIIDKHTCLSTFDSRGQWRGSPCVWCSGSDKCKDGNNKQTHCEVNAVIDEWRGGAGWISSSVQRLLASSCSSPPCIVAAVASHGGCPCRGIDSGRIFSSFSSASHGTVYSQLRYRCKNIGSSFHHRYFCLARIKLRMIGVYAAY